MYRAEPKIFLVGEMALNHTQLYEYLNYIKTNWRPGSHSSNELLIEIFGRLCYRSWEPLINPNVTKVREGNDKYIKHILDVGHESVIEHAVTSWIFADVSRVFTHELVRHRAGTAFSQESLRFVRLDDLGLWLPNEVEDDEGLKKLFEDTFKNLEELQLKMAEYLKLDEEKSFDKKKKWTSAMRRIAPLGLATTIGFTCNLRELRHIIQMRTSNSAEVEMKFVFDKVAKICKEKWPNVFCDFERNGDGEWITPNKKV